MSAAAASASNAVTARSAGRANAAVGGPPPRAAVNKWIIACTVMFGTFIAVMDISVVNVALPQMMGSFGVDLSAVTWVATSYSIAEIIMLSMAGWLSTLLGRKRLYMLSFALFTVGSMLCGTATTFPQMLVYRVIQGIGGGTLIPVSQAILREAFPDEELGMAMAVYSMGVVLAPAIGPVLGGWLTDVYGWPWIFYINVPVSIIGLVMVGAFVFDPAYLRRGVKSVDWVGIGLLAVMLTTMQVVLERGQEENWFESRWIVIGTVVCVLSLVMLLIWEMSISEPVVNFRLLKNVPLSLGTALGLVFGVALFGTTFILPEYAQDLLGYSAYDAGMLLLPRAIALMAILPLAGALYRYVDARILCIFGCLVIGWSYWDLAQLSLDAGFWTIVPMLLIMGAGMPFMFVTMSAVSLSTVPRADVTEASSLYTLGRRVGGNIGYAIVATLVARGEQMHRSDLASHVSVLNGTWHQTQAHLTHALTSAGLNPTAVTATQYGMVNKMLHSHATMLAYNDVSWIFLIMFVCMIPFLLFMPGRPPKAAPQGGH
ncbi:MAG: DHA2 family efflux MFS transporter permease subunit [Planctomycetota bacterium]